MNRDSFLKKFKTLAEELDTDVYLRTKDVGNVFNMRIEYYGIKKEWDKEKSVFKEVKDLDRFRHFGDLFWKVGDKHPTYAFYVPGTKHESFDFGLACMEIVPQNTVVEVHTDDYNHVYRLTAKSVLGKCKNERNADKKRYEKLITVLAEEFKLEDL